MTQVIFEKKTPRGIFKVFIDKPVNDVFFEVEQVHGKTILMNESDKKADGIIIDNSTILTPLAIKTADCIPLLVIGQRGHGLLHAGWRGVQLQIHTQNEVAKLKPTYFLIGPHICADCFQVTEEFYDHFPQSKELFSQKNDKITFDLAKQIEKDLQKSFPKAKIEKANLCTFCNSNFNSYRRDKTSLRNWNIYFPSQG